MISFNQIFVIALLLLVFTSIASEDTCCLSMSIFPLSLIYGRMIDVELEQEFVIGQEFSFQDPNGFWIKGEITNLEEGNLRVEIEVTTSGARDSVDENAGQRGVFEKLIRVIPAMSDTLDIFTIRNNESKQFEHKFTWSGEGYGKTMDLASMVSFGVPREEWTFWYKVKLTKLEKYEVFLEDNALDPWGLNIQGIWPLCDEYDITKVQRVEKNKQADRLGIRIGDKLISVNGIKTSKEREKQNIAKILFDKNAISLQFSRKSQEKVLSKLKRFGNKYRYVFGFQLVTTVLLFSILSSRKN